ncbi:DNA mismatch repair protein MutS [Brevibacillus composti]|uniref:DNA mismatch repair protein MutS n=1 Tax=Brevibacillus composti TaxID=2796470 RepID=A0A7T5EP62_9BACL|nr:DNA mismatch repair protein MutS [Brevibacillus composti]QQE76233.1 DNA mismatch repair protein MutS [Brevibacillus composti]QUO43262.1 DNA mismatch repair protein MutS [Brevibacillus composti]
MTQYTPMIQQYLAIKKDYPDTFLFFRLGDFYELFFDDAIAASRELEITLTGREGGGAEKIPMCGVPHHSADAYIAELLKNGYKVAVCEQVEDPKEAKGVVRREVTRVITPGTMMEGKWLADKENNYLVALADAHGSMGVAACDMSTGEMYVTSLAGRREAALDEAMQYRPKELVVTGWSGELKTDVPLTSLDPSGIDASAVDAQYGADASGLDLPMRLAVNALLHYIGVTQKRSLTHMRLIKRYDAKQYLQMDSFSRRNLELTETIRDKSKKGSLLWLLDRTETAMGGRMLRRWIERPLVNKSELEARLDAVAHLKGDLLLRADVRRCLDQVYDLERLAGRISYGNANARDLVQLRLSLESVPELKGLLLGSGSPVLHELASGMDECADIAAFLQAALVDDPPISVREGGLIRSGYDAYLDKLHTASREGKTWIAQLEQTEREATGIRSLKVGFNKVFGYYIEVSRANLANIPAGRYERKQTLANAERFITPELKEKEALILEAEEKLIELEYQLFVQVRSEVALHIPRLQNLAERIAAIDVLQAFATVSDERGYVRPELVTTGECVISEGRHPVVEAVLEREKYVANDVEMNQTDRQILLITGPNMAGKSTYMRQIALLVVMAQIGCFVPAKAARLSLVDQIFTRIGAADDLVGGHSTFMVEMLETKHALQKATAQSLILLDEIGRGTSTYDGMALAQSVIEYIQQKIGAKTLFSTHYHELTGLAESLPGVVNVNARCEERGGKLLFLHKIEPGRADKSYGIHVAELAEMPREVIDRAREILSGLEQGSTLAKAGDQQLSLDTLWSAQATSAAALDESATRLSPEEEQIVAELRELDLNQTTPMDAMLKLFQWKQQLKKG